MGEPVAGRPVGQPGGGQVAGVDLGHRGRLDGGQRRGQPGHQPHGVDQLGIGPCRPQHIRRRRGPSPTPSASAREGPVPGTVLEIDIRLSNQAPPTPEPVINRVIPPSEIIHRKRNSGPLIVHRNQKPQPKRAPQASGDPASDLRRYRTPPPTETTPRRSSPTAPSETPYRQQATRPAAGVSTGSTNGRGSRQARPTAGVSTGSTHEPGSRQARPAEMGGSSQAPGIMPR